jgi:hypothetical protein
MFLESLDLRVLVLNDSAARDGLHGGAPRDPDGRAVPVDSIKTSVESAHAFSA